MDLQEHHEQLMLRVRDMSLDAKKAHVRTMYVCPPAHQKILEKMEECARSSTRDPEPRCMLITGQTGAGKTTLAKQCLARHPVRREDSETVVPVLFLTMPARATLHSLASKMLFAIRDPGAFSGSTHLKTLRLLELMHDCAVQLIVMDEGHHFFDKDDARIMENTMDWMKALILDSQIATIILGLAKTASIVAKNEQLSRRFAERHVLLPFDDGPEYRRFLSFVDADLPLESAALSEDEMAMRIHEASDGTIGYVMRLIREAAIMALDEGLNRITLELLADSFDAYVATDKPNKKNPFL